MLSGLMYTLIYLPQIHKDDRKAGLRAPLFSRRASLTIFQQYVR